MRQVEDVAMDALPASSDMDNSVSGAAKAEQLGTEAMTALLDSTLNDFDTTHRSCVIFNDLRPKSSHALTACLNKSRSINYKLLYTGVCENMVELSWIKNFHTKDIANRIGNGEWKLPNFTSIQKEPPSDLLEASPTAPVLNVLPLGGYPPTHPRPAESIKILMWNMWYNVCLCSLETSL